MVKDTLSPAASSALVNASSNRQGTAVPATGDVFWELEAAGLIGINGGLTRKGSIRREQIVTRLLDAAF